MKATIDKPQRSILAPESFVDDVGSRSERNSTADSGGPRPERALVVVVSMVIVVAAFGWTTLGDSGAQLLKTESSPTTTVPAEAPDDAPARSSVDRDALVVDVERLDLGAGTESTTSTVSTTAAANSGSAGATDSAPAPSRSMSTSAGAPGSGEGALRAAGTPSSSTGPTARSSTAAASTATNASVVPPPTPTTAAPPTASLTSSPPTSTTAGVAWEEHFNSLDTGRWQIEHSTYGDGNGERQCYQPGNVRVANGRLVLTARAETATCPNGSTRTVTSGMVRSRGLTFSPGQAIEFRVKLTPPNPSNQAGLWPAVWASSWAGSWPRGGELDFLEVMTAEDPRRAVFSMHYADRSGGHELQNKGVPLGGYFSDGWHTIRFDYGRNGNLEWFLDGARVFSVSAAETVQGYPAPFDQTIHEIKLNLAVGGTPGPLSSGALGSVGATFEIDYIRVINL